jgi:hypothetical protein
MLIEERWEKPQILNFRVREIIGVTNIDPLKLNK